MFRDVHYTQGEETRMLCWQSTIASSHDQCLIGESESEKSTRGRQKKRLTSLVRKTTQMNDFLMLARVARLVIPTGRAISTAISQGRSTMPGRPRKDGKRNQKGPRQAP